MSGAKSDPVRFQVAEAGFGAMLERHGFQLVPRARCHWRRDGEGVTWRVAVHDMTDMDVPQDETWIDVSYGVQLHGFNELCEKAGEKPRTSPLKGTRHRLHLPGSLTDDVWFSEVNRFDELWRRRSWLSRLFYHLHPFERPYFDDWLDVPHLRRFAHMSAFGWTPGDDPVTQFTQHLTELFETLSIPKIRSRLDVASNYTYWFGDEPDPDSIFILEMLAASKLARRDDVIRRIADHRLAHAFESFEETRARVTLRPPRVTDPNSSEYLTENERVLLQRLFDLAVMRELLAFSRALDLGIKDPGIDFSPYERAKADFGPEAHFPDDSVRRELNKQDADWTLKYR